MTLLSRFWKWLLLSLASIALLFGVYWSGRRNRKGEVDLSIATRQLEAANEKHEQLSGKLQDLQEQRKDLIADVIEAEIIGGAKTPDDVLARLRKHGLVK